MAELPIPELHSVEFGALAEALSKVQGELENASKNAEGHFKDDQGNKNTYANLAECLNAPRALLAKNGLSVTHPMISINGRDIMHTLLLHKSNQWLRCIWDIGTASDTAPQKKGSAITYARRYTFCALVGLTQEDDDGQKGTAEHNIQDRIDKAVQSAINKTRTEDIAVYSRLEDFTYRMGMATSPEDIEAIYTDQKIIKWRARITDKSDNYPAVVKTVEEWEAEHILSDVIAETKERLTNPPYNIRELVNAQGE